MIVVTNRIPVNEGHEDDFEDRFKKRVHLVDSAPGFVRNEVHRPKPMKMGKDGFSPDPDGEGFYEIKTWWQSVADFQEWIKSPSFAEAHKDKTPKDMFRGANILEVHEVIQSTDLDFGI